MGGAASSGVGGAASSSVGGAASYSHSANLKIEAVVLRFHPSSRTPIFHNHTKGLGAHIFQKVLIVYLVANLAADISLTVKTA